MSWLDSLTPESELRSQQQRIEFTSAIPSEKTEATSYTTVVTVSYGATIMVMLLILVWRLMRMTLRGSRIGFGQKRTARFFLSQIPRTVFTAIWSGLIFGTLIATLATLTKWLAF